MINVGITPLQNKILSINQNSIKMNLGGSHQIVVSNSDNKVLSYSTLDSTVATVSDTGLVTIQGYGDTSIIVSDGERQASVYVEVPTGLSSRSIYYGIISNDTTALTIADVVNYVKNGTLKSIPLQETKILQETPGNFVVLVPNKDYECYKMGNTLTYFKHKGERMVGEFFIYGETITEECVVRVVNKKQELNLSEVFKPQLVNVVKDIIKEYGGGGGDSQNSEDIDKTPIIQIGVDSSLSDGYTMEYTGELSLDKLQDTVYVKVNYYTFEYICKCVKLSIDFDGQITARVYRHINYDNQFVIDLAIILNPELPNSYIYILDLYWNTTSPGTLVLTSEYLNDDIYYTASIPQTMFVIYGYIPTIKVIVNNGYEIYYSNYYKDSNDIIKANIENNVESFNLYIEQLNGKFKYYHNCRKK